jgi:hypothetical protein
MVEMVETAAILNQATERSLVILDEIGRGTATFDGLSIAWAAVEHLHEEPLPRPVRHAFPRDDGAVGKARRAANVTMRVKEWEGDVVFLHEVGPGAADRSYGIQVARLAGLPAPENRGRVSGGNLYRGLELRDFQNHVIRGGNHRLVHGLGVGLMRLGWIVGRLFHAATFAGIGVRRDIGF